MKLVEGKWVAKSLDGKVRRFKELKDAEHWRANHSKDILPAKELTLKQYLDQLDQIEATAKAAMKPTTSQIWAKFQAAVGDSFPDGDPFDRMGSWMYQHHVTMDDVDAAVREHNGVQSAHDYLAQMWSDYAADAEHDAMQGAHGQTYDDGQWFQRPNPWK